MRPLCVRVKDRLDGKERIRKSTPSGALRFRAHKGRFKVAIKILARKTQLPIYLAEGRCFNYLSPVNQKDEPLIFQRAGNLPKSWKIFISIADEMFGRIGCISIH